MRCVKEHALVMGDYTITIDSKVRVAIGEEVYEIYSSPNDLEYLAIGLGALKGKLLDVRSIRVGDEILIEAKDLGPLELRVRDGKVEWEEIVKALRELYSIAPKSKCPLAVHLGAAYVWEGRYVRKKVMMDVSRHALALKLAGYMASTGGNVPLALLSARISGDAAKALASGGFKVLAAFHHPLLSTIRAVAESGVTLIGKNAMNELSVIANPSRIEGYAGPSLRLEKRGYQMMGDEC
ncbi:hypothetical protein IPA_06675 [Ignicoccus pacificus DSM 13166]|uniref:Uncharacterized protein n=1 Tax=Ignicoccus pacificus DSM 13166 TaxID=940294 RepID=A0A977PL35_9CREN|nr:hypothetical protein IPA_06675 [Ignicoccus pacificus DSM 13166]